MLGKTWHNMTFFLIRFEFLNEKNLAQLDKMRDQLSLYLLGSYYTDNMKQIMYRGRVKLNNITESVSWWIW